AYNLMLFAQRRALHRAVADWYERAHTGDLVPYYPLLAHHWRQASVAAKAQDYLDLAGEQALHSGAYREALHFLSEALALDDEGRKTNQESPHPDSDRSSSTLRLARRERMLAEALHGLGEPAASRAHLLRALALLGRPVPAAGTSLVANIIVQLLRQV